MTESANTESTWEFNAPQYIDFNSHIDEEDVESYFDVDHERVFEEGYFNPSQEEDGVGVQDADGVKRQTRKERQEKNANREVQTSSKTEHPKKKTATLTEEAPSTPTPGNRRLTRSMCATPVNDKGLPEATEPEKEDRLAEDKLVEEKEEYHSAPASPAQTTAADQTAEPVLREKKKTPANICTNLEEWRKKTVGAKQILPNNRNQPTNKSAVKVNAGAKPQTRRSVNTTHHHRTSSSTERPEVKHVRSHSLTRTQSLRQAKSVEKLNNTARAHNDSKTNSSLTRSRSLKRGHSTDNLQNTSSGRVTRSMERGSTPRGRSDSTASTKSNASTGESEGPSHKMPKLTIPSTPSFMKRKPVGKTGDQVKNAEEKELEEIAHMRKELAKKRKMAQMSYQKAMTSTGYIPHHSSKEPTMPVDIKFSTDARIKSHLPESNQSEDPKDFARSLRSSSKDSAHGSGPVKGITRPEPFSLSESRKRKLDVSTDKQSSGFKSMAEHVQAFHRQTPERFRSKTKTLAPPERCARGRSPGKLTVPKTPQFETRTRTRQVHVPSQKEKEEQELEEMKKHQVKAHPVNHRILTESCLGVKKVAPKPCTQPEEFNLHHRNQDRKVNQSQEEEEKHQFHANPCPRKILEGPVGVKPAKEIPLTHPQSPAFALKHRVRMNMEPAEEKKVEEAMVKAHPVPHSGVPFQPKLSHSCTVPQPFSFQDRDQAIEVKKKEKIREVLDEEKKAREFHAQPLPDHEPVLPPRHPLPLTRPEPFDLHVDKRGVKRAEEWSHKLAEEEEEQKQKISFKAKPATVTHKVPYIPQKSTKPLTDITEFTLRTEQRSEKREDYEMFKKAKEAQLEAQKRQHELRREEEEKKIIAKLRKQAVHHANPIRRFKQVEVVPSDKPLTNPASPQFQTDRRLRSRVQTES